MKAYKTIDAWVSVVIILAGLLHALIAPSEIVIYWYFIAGGWQVLSMLVHFFKKCFMTPGTWRVFYHYVVLAVFGFAGITWLVQDALLPFLFVMLFAAPVMATLYTMICMKEVYIKMQRPIAVLK